LCGQASRGGAERTRCLSRDRDQRNFEAARIIDQVFQLGGFARPRQRDDHVVGENHAEVAVARFGGMDEEGRRASGGEGRGDLVRDMARLAHARDDDAAFGAANGLNRGNEGRAETVLHCRRKRGDAAGFGFQRAQARGDQGLAGGIGGSGCLRLDGGH
jgi:hypothetical protein